MTANGNFENVAIAKIFERQSGYAGNENGWLIVDPRGEGDDEFGEYHTKGPKSNPKYVTLVATTMPRVLTATSVYILVLQVL